MERQDRETQGLGTVMRIISDKAHLALIALQLTPSRSLPAEKH